MSKHFFRGTISAIVAGAFAATFALGVANASPTMAYEPSGYTVAVKKDEVKKVDLKKVVAKKVAAKKVVAKKVVAKKVVAHKVVAHKVVVHKPTVHKPAVRRNVVVQIDRAPVQHITVHKGQKIWLAVDKNNVNGIDVSNKLHGVLRPVKTNVFGLNDKQTAAIGFKKNVQPEGDVFKAAKLGRAKIVATETRPTLGGVHTHWNEVVYVHVKK